MQQRHRDVAAYALGVLEPADAFRLRGASRRVRDVHGTALRLRLRRRRRWPNSPDPSGSRPLPGPRLLDRLTDEVAVLRRRSRRRRLRLVAAAAALIVALPAAAVALRSGGAVARRRQGRGDGRQDRCHRVRGGAEDGQWGTAVALRLTHLTGPRTCRLVAVGKDGIEHPVLSWSVPEGGYGIRGRRGHEEPLDIEGGTDVPSGEIGRWEVRTLDGQPLVTLKG